MSAAFVLLVVLSYLSRGSCFEFFIARELNSTKELPKDVWSRVEVLGTETDRVTVKIDVPMKLSYSDVFIFFANDAKEILRVKMNESVSGSFYAMPHKIVKEMQAGETSTVENVNFRQVSGDFPKSWLPGNFTKVSATVMSRDDKYYNYYGVQNFDIGIPDLMVLEEYKKLPTN